MSLFKQFTWFECLVFLVGGIALVVLVTLPVWS